MDIKPTKLKGRLIIGSYGAGGFSIAGERYNGSVIIIHDKVISWPINNFNQINKTTLAPIFNHDNELDLLIIGTGSVNCYADNNLQQEISGLDIMIDIMDTGSACRTFNILLSEDRLMAAALISID